MAKKSKSDDEFVIALTRQSRDEIPPELGQNFHVLSDAEAKRARLLVCVGLTTPLLFPDNRTGPCVDCGDTLQWRPHAPKQAARICLGCADIRRLRLDMAAHHARKTNRGR